jgi:hypothetical protein
MHCCCDAVALHNSQINKKKMVMKYQMSYQAIAVVQILVFCQILHPVKVIHMTHHH